MVNKSKTAKLNIPMTIAAILLCLTMISFHMTSGLYAKYLTNGSGGDFARVITFGELTLTEEGNFYDTGKLMIVPAVDLQKRVMVEFDGSEAATYVFVELDVSTNWQRDGKVFKIVDENDSNVVLMQLSVADGWDSLDTGDGKNVFFQALEPNVKLNKVDVIAADGKVTVSKEITLKNISQLEGTFINVQASVVQLGGFENAADAWASIND